MPAKRPRVSKQVRAERQAAARKIVAARRQRRVGLVSILIVVIIGVFGVLSAANRPQKKERDEPESTAATFAKGPPPCPKEDGSSRQHLVFPQEPGRCIDATKTYEARIETTAGLLVAELYPNKAFRAVNNFVFLARYHFYDGLAFHKVLRDAFVQTGEPIAPTITGPGYVFNDDGLPLSSAEYSVGSLLFAHEKPNENGSQILIISGTQGATLEPVFPLFGKITRGLDVLGKINAGGTNDINTPRPRYSVVDIEVRELKPR